MERSVETDGQQVMETAEDLGAGIPLGLTDVQSHRALPFFIFLSAKRLTAP